MHEVVKRALVAVLIIVMTGCSAARKHKSSSPAEISSDAGAVAIAEGVRSHNITEKGFVIKRGRIEIEGTDTDGSFSLNARVNNRGDFVVSVRGPLGIELVRLLAVGNDIAMIDRIGRTVYLGKKDEIMLKNGMPDDFIETLFGDLPGTGYQRYSKTGNSLVVSSESYGVTEREYTICFDEMKVCRAHLTDKSNDREIFLEFGNFTSGSNIKYPQSVVMDDNKRDMRIKLSIDELESGYESDIDFTLPDYKRSNL